VKVIATPSKSTSVIAKHAGGRVRAALVPHWLVHLGVLGLLAVAIVDSSPIPLPLPGSTDLLLLILVSHHGNPFLMVAAAIVGSLIGGYLTWSAGKRGGEALLRRSLPKRFREPLEKWAKLNSTLSVFLFALLPPPVPLAPVLLAAGTLGMPRNRFLAALASARVIRYGAIAWAAEVYGRIVLRWWTRNLAGWSNVILTAFIVLLVGGTVYGIWQYRRQSRREAEARAYA
jgi:membrane protein YqaA with SNARE-associated domain